MGLNVTKKTVSNLLEKLETAGIVKKAITEVDRRYRNYELNKDFPVQLIFKRSRQLTSWKLLKFIRFEGVLVEEILKNEAFAKACTKHFLSPDEGILVLKENKRKVEYRIVARYNVKKEALFLRR